MSEISQNFSIFISFYVINFHFLSIVLLFVQASSRDPQCVLYELESVMFYNLH